VDGASLVRLGDSAEFVETDAGLTATGTLTVSDADVTDVVEVSVTGVVASGNTGTLDDATLQGFLTLSPQPALDGTEASDQFTWTFDSLGEAFDFLAEGETLTLTYTLVATDNSGEPNHESAPFEVTITITGTNDAPVITGGLTGSVSESGDIAGIDEAGPSGPFEPVQLTPEIVAA